MASESRGYRRNVKRRLQAESLENRIVLASDLAIVAGGEALLGHLPEQSHVPSALAVGFPSGDLNGDGNTDAADIDAVAAAIRLDRTNTDYDLDNSGVVDQADKDMLVRDILGTNYGDANLDMVIDSTDYEIWSQNRFSMNRGWANGDFSGDYVVDVSDFNVWNAYRGSVAPTVTLTGSDSFSTGIIRSAHPASTNAGTTAGTELPGKSDVTGARGVDGGDFNGDSTTDATDIDMLMAAIRDGNNAAAYDLDLSGTVDSADLDMMVQGILNTNYGDYDLNGVVDGNDLAAVTGNIFQTGTGWATGDFNGDGATDVSDFNRWNENRSSIVREKVVDSTPEKPLATVADSSSAVKAADTETGTTVRLQRVGEGLSGDVNGDTELNAADIDMLAHAIRTGDQGVQFDLNNDSIVDHEDMDTMIYDVLGTEYGDANLDNVVDSTDFDAWEKNSYQSDTGWASADFNGDGVTDASDFNVWNSHRAVAGPVSVVLTGVDETMDESEEEDSDVNSAVQVVEGSELTKETTKKESAGMQFRYLRFM